MHERVRKCTVYIVKFVKRAPKFILSANQNVSFFKNNYLCRAAFIYEMRPIDKN